MNVIILSGRFGMGHRMAAEAIGEEFLHQDPKSNIIEVDLLEYLYPIAHKFLYIGFHMLVEKCHTIYNWIHRFSRRVEVDMKPAGFSVYRKLRCLIERYQPDMIICTLPLCAQAIASYKEKTGCKIPLITCITDISTHPEWVISNVESYLAPTVSIKNHLIQAGKNANSIYVTGIPVRQEFLNHTEVEKKKSLKHQEKHILIMGGGLGLLPHMDCLMEFIHQNPHIKATVLTGKNKKAYKRLNGKYDNVNILGYTNHVSDYMQEADLIITKVGGSTLFEILHCETPMFVIHPFLEQEVYNAHFVEEQNIGMVVWKRSENYILQLQELLLDDKKLNTMRKNIVQSKKEIIEIELEQVVQIWNKGSVA
ncbi:MAG: glycosyltransferase [Lachnospiraceae bacterium]